MGSTTCFRCQSELLAVLVVGVESDVGVELGIDVEPDVAGISLLQDQGD